MPAWQSAKAVSVYLSMPSGEISTSEIVRTALRERKDVYVPNLYKSLQSGKPKSVMDMVALHSEADYEALEPDRWGIPSVPPSSVAQRRRVLGDENGPDESTRTAVLNRLDLVVTPGVAFDRTLKRLGHGKGFYDSFFASYLAGVHDRTAMPHLRMHSGSLMVSLWLTIS